jgi:hypothetical protein
MDPYTPPRQWMTRNGDWEAEDPTCYVEFREYQMFFSVLGFRRNSEAAN